MGYLRRSGLPKPGEPPAVTAREFVEAAEAALVLIAREAWDDRYRPAVEELARGRPRRAVRLLLTLLRSRPQDPVLHRRLGLAYLCGGDARRGAHHLEAALLLLERAMTVGPPLLRSLGLQMEAALVRLALLVAYERLGHRAGVMRCLLPGCPGSNHPFPR